MPSTGGSATAAGCSFGPWGCVAGAAVDIGSSVLSQPATPGGIFDSPMRSGGSFADQGNWTVATSGSKASNSGAATASTGDSGLSTGGYDKYLIMGMGLLALAMAWKTLKH